MGEEDLGLECEDRGGKGDRACAPRWPGWNAEKAGRSLGERCRRLEDRQGPGPKWRRLGFPRRGLPTASVTPKLGVPDGSPARSTFHSLFFYCRRAHFVCVARGRLSPGPF